MNEYDFKAAHDAARFNKTKLARDSRCGCFYCLHIFSPAEIYEWIPEENGGTEVTALCPYCGIDAVIGESSGFPITQEFLKVMGRKYFDGDDYYE